MKHAYPVPEFFHEENAGSLFSVPHEERLAAGRAIAKAHDIGPQWEDELRIALLVIDNQVSFSIPGFELFVGGRSGDGAVMDTARLCRFIYQNVGHLTGIICSLDYHYLMQIFFASFFVDTEGNHPVPMTTITREDLEKRRWRVHPSVVQQLGKPYDQIATYVISYAAELENRGKYLLTIWPYHTLMGTIGHALVPLLWEAVLYHTAARQVRQPYLLTKGADPLRESYSILQPEVRLTLPGDGLVCENPGLAEALFEYDAVIVAGQAKSHCVGWTIADMLTYAKEHDPSLVERIYLLEDCMSSVVVPGIVDFTDATEEAFARFADAGMHRVKSTEPMATWPGVIGSGVVA